MSDTHITTALVPVEQRAALALDSTATEKHLRELATKHASITVIKNKDGREQAHGAAMELKRARVEIEKVSKDARDDATKFSKAVIAEEKRLIGIIETEEKRLFEIRDAWDAEQERIRQEKVLAEQRRVEAINARINEIANAPLSVANADAGRIETELLHWQLQELAEADFEESFDKAKYILGETIAKLQELLATAKAREAEAKRVAEEQRRIAEENTRLAAERAELDRQRRELEEATARAAAEAALAAQRAIDEANAKSKAEAAQREAFMKQQQDAFDEERRAAQELLAKQQAEIAEQQAAIAAQVRAQREAEEAARRAQEKEERQARELEERQLYCNVVAAIQGAMGLEDADAIDSVILRAAAVIKASKKELA